MPGRHFLFVPGPTNIPDRIIRSMAVPSEDHRNPTFPDLVMPILKDLKKVFRTTKGQAFIFPSTGTGGWEAALANTLSPGDKVLASRYGQFSHLWIDLAKRLGLNVEVIEEEWGTGTHPEHILAKLEADKKHEIKAVLVVQNETATGVTSDVAAVTAWGLKVCAKEAKWNSDTVSAILVPEGFNGADVISTAYKRYNLALGAGLSQVAGKLFRIGHLGDLNELMVLGALAGAEMSMLDVGIKIEPGSGVAAAQRHFRASNSKK